MNNEPTFDNVQVLKSVRTVGMLSTVRIMSEMRQEYVTIGHASFYDFEDATIEDITSNYKLRRVAPITFIFRSSKGNFHGICPTVKSVNQIYEDKEVIDIDDHAHNDIGFKKGRWTLRVTHKGYKPSPKLLGCVKGLGYNLRDVTFSNPHLEYLAQKHNSKEAKTLIEECKTVGDATKLVAYQTHENNHVRGA